jgi:hypothetical protein
LLFGSIAVALNYSETDGRSTMGKDSLTERIAKEEAGQAAVKKEAGPESAMKKAVTKIKKAVTEEHRRKGFI